MLPSIARSRGAHTKSNQSLSSPPCRSNVCLRVWKLGVLRIHANYSSFYSMDMFPFIKWLAPKINLINVSIQRNSKVFAKEKPTYDLGGPPGFYGRTCDLVRLALSNRTSS
jgi:hypothetical protein